MIDTLDVFVSDVITGWRGGNEPSSYFRFKGPTCPFASTTTMTTQHHNVQGAFHFSNFNSGAFTNDMRRSLRFRKSASGNEPNGPHQGQLPSPESGGQQPGEDSRVQHPTSVNEGRPKTSPVESDIKPRSPDSSSRENKEAGICTSSLNNAGANGIDYDMEDKCVIAFHTIFVAYCQFLRESAEMYPLLGRKAASQVVHFTSHCSS